MKKRHILTLIISIATIVIIYFGASSSNPIYTESNVKKSSGQKLNAEKEFTIMIFMNGSDLESVYAAGTADIKEMAASRFDERNINLLIFTGGSRKWHMRDIPNDANTIFQMKNGKLSKLTDAGNDSAGDPKTLSAFIDYCQTEFPAKKYGLILWNHGGGAIVGYGADERYEQNPEKAVMRLTEIDNAFSNSIKGRNLEFIGFDTCLMSTIEMANIAEKYSSYLIASEEVEPEQGWDYSFLGQIKLNDSGYEIGKYIIDSYARFYEKMDLRDFATLSMTDLSKIDSVSESFENLAAAAGTILDLKQYNGLSRARARTRAFGSGGEDGETDMVDLLEISNRLEQMFPEESTALSKSIEKAVVYKYESNNEDIGGLSVYFPFHNKENLSFIIETYSSINQLPKYTALISDFGEILSSDPMVDFYNEPNIFSDELMDYVSDIRVTSWVKTNYHNEDDESPYYIQISDNTEVGINEDGSLEYENSIKTLNGYFACLYDTNNSDIKRYTIPVTLNGEDANLIVIFSDNLPTGSILGAIPTDNDVFNTIDKKLIKIKDGDKLALRYYAFKFSENGEATDEHKEETWLVGDEFTVKGGLELLSEEAIYDEFVQKIKIIDTQNNSYYFEF